MTPSGRGFFSVRRAGKVVLVAAGLWLFLNAAAFVDVTLRARSAYIEGVKYLQWHEDPSVKKDALDVWLATSKAKLRPSEDRELLEESLLMQYEIKMGDNDAKNAYYWFQTVIECFQPPRSAYVRKAEKQIQIAEELWRNSR